MNDAFENTFKQFMDKNTAKVDKLAPPVSKGFPSGKTASDSGNDGKSQYNFLNSSSKDKGSVQLRPITIEEVLE